MKYVLYWQIFYFVMTLIPLFIGGYCKNIYLLLYLFMICRACAYIVNMFLSYHFAKKLELRRNLLFYFFVVR